MDRLTVADGVVVQGPPGTGKTHTIANIISHYLAHGKRVLVTSRGEAALKVIREQLPEGIRDLVVTRFIDEREGAKQLEGSIRKIQDEVNSTTEGSLRNDIKRLKGTIEDLHRTMETQEEKLHEIAVKNSTPVESDTEGRTPIEIARDVATHAQNTGVIPDSLGMEARFEPKFSAGDLKALGEARERLGAGLRDMGTSVPARASLPSVEEIKELHADIYVAQDRMKQQAVEHTLTMKEGLTPSAKRVKNLLEIAQRKIEAWEVV